MNTQKFTIIESPFDQGILAEHVANVSLRGSFCSRVEEEIVGEASDRGFELLMLKSPIPLKTQYFYPVGELLRLQGALNRVLSNLAPMRKRFTTRLLRETDWNSIEKALDGNLSNRFVYDPNIDSRSCCRLKMKLLKKKESDANTFSRVAINDVGRLLGFQVAVLLEKNLDFYEILTLPEARVGFLGGQLILENLEDARVQESDLETLTTSVFVENKASMNFFSKIGMQQVIEKSFFYHYWKPSRLEGRA